MPDDGPPPGTGALQDGVALVHGVRIRYRVCGSGQPVLLLHGWGSSLASYAPTMNELAKFFRVVAFDFPGHGESELPPAAWSVDDFVQLTLGALDRFGIGRSAILGHSFGGRVAIKLAAGHAERVSRLILVDAAGVPVPPTLRRRFRRALGRMAKPIGRAGPLGRRLKSWIVSKVASTDYLSAGPLLPTFLRVINEDLTPFLSRISCPTLLIWGDRDDDTPLTTARTMERLIPNAQLTVLKNAGHFSYIDQFGRFRLAVLSFLNQ